jgi:hypothetical protein
MNLPTSCRMFIDSSRMALLCGLSDPKLNKGFDGLLPPVDEGGRNWVASGSVHRLRDGSSCASHGDTGLEHILAAARRLEERISQPSFRHPGISAPLGA